MKKLFAFTVYLHTKEEKDELIQRCGKGIVVYDEQNRTIVCKARYFHKILGVLQKMDKKIYEIRAF